MSLSTRLREHVIELLLEKGVSVDPHPSTEDDMLTLSRGDVLVSVRLSKECSKKMLQTLSRKFEIAIHLFYN
jgi:hypothetical protein